MELHPYYEKSSTSPQTNLWYVLATGGDSPSMRVGCSATFIRGKSEEGDGRLYIIGGANPDGTFSEINLLDLTTMAWDRLDTPSHVSRYEHAVSTYRPNSDEASASIFVFGGAVQSGNLNDVQEYSTGDDRWSTVTIQGDAPSARTQHSMSAFFSDGRLVVYGGGQSGSDPVTDRQTHIFDPSSSTWTTPYVSGQPPKPRHGHLIVACCSDEDKEKENKIYLHGGMTGNVFYDDLFVLDLAKNQWSELKVGRRRPCSRAAHGGVIWKEKLYIFGGMTKNGALDDMWSFDIGTKSWTEIKYDGPPPPCRLDFAYCLISLRRKAEPSSSANSLAEGPSSPAGDDLVNGTKEPADTCAPDSKPDESQSEPSVSTTRSGAAAINVATQNEKAEETGHIETCVFFLIWGGMDTEGTIFDDTLIFMIDREPVYEEEKLEGAASKSTDVF